MKNKHFINLTNGIEKIPELNSSGIEFSFIRIQSTTLERKDYIKLLQDLDHNLLIHLALGFNCIIYDYGTNRNISKTIYLGIPFIEYTLNKLWYNLDEVPYRYTRSTYEKLKEPSFGHIYNDIFIHNQNNIKNNLKTKLKYYKKFLNSDKINIKGVSKSTNNDGKYQYYFELLNNNYGN